MFPQGEIHSIYNDAVVFENGVERIIKKTAPETQVVFIANLIDYFSNSKPNLFIYFKSLLAQDLQKTTVEKEYNTLRMLNGTKESKTTRRMLKSS